MEKRSGFVGKHEWFVVFGSIKEGEEQAERKGENQIPDCRRGSVHRQHFKGELSEKDREDKQKGKYVEGSKQNVVGEQTVDPGGDVQYP